MAGHSLVGTSEGQALKKLTEFHDLDPRNKGGGINKTIETVRSRNKKLSSPGAQQMCDWPKSDRDIYGHNARTQKCTR